MVTFLEGEAGVFCVAALLGRLQKKEEVMYVTATFNSPRTSPHRTHSAANLAKLKAVHDIAMGTPSNELLYGKAGACPDMALRCSCSCCVCVCAAEVISLTSEQCSWLTSCVGYLYSLLFALKHIKPDDAELADLAMKIALQIIKEGRERKYVSLSVGA